jgi:hypothetical protein
MPAFIIGFPGGLSSTGLSTVQAGLKAGIHMTGFPIWKEGQKAEGQVLQ